MRLFTQVVTRAIKIKANLIESDPNFSAVEAAMSKRLAPQSAFDAIHKCLLLHGHAGYDLASKHQQRLRDVMGYEIGDGTAEIMNRIIARRRQPEFGA